MNVIIKNIQKVIPENIGTVNNLNWLMVSDCNEINELSYGSCKTSVSEQNICKTYIQLFSAD